MIRKMYAMEILKEMCAHFQIIYTLTVLFYVEDPKRKGIV